MSKTFAKKLKGKWEITQMDQWDAEPEWFIEFDGKGNGFFHFICVDPEIDYRINDAKIKKAEISKINLTQRYQLLVFYICSANPKYII